MPGEPPAAAEAPHPFAAFRDPVAVRACADALAARATRPWTLMEVCGGQTHAILRHGLDQLLPDSLALLHGPGCPVCVTPLALIDHAHALARVPDLVFATFGDMLRVPGSGGDLLTARAEGADVRVVLSPLDALALARAMPAREVVFFAIGFETTAPATALAVAQAAREKLANFSLLVAHVRVTPVLEAMLADPACRVQGLLAPGHVCAVTGWDEYQPLAARFGVPIVVTGFEPHDLLHGMLACVGQLESGRAVVENAYPRGVSRAGNPAARALLAEVYTPVDREWRGLGPIRAGGYDLRAGYAAFDAARRHPWSPGAPIASLSPASACRSGEVLQGRCLPSDCPHFGTRCTPVHPLGATMVSSEGACAAYYRYRQPAAA